MLPILVHIHLTLAGRFSREEGQTSAEYALVVLGAVGVALLVGAWAQHTHKITDLLDALFDTVTKHVK
jgi:Flp pilus assembly pilin Flp